MLLDLANSVISSSINPEAQFNQNETTLIRPPLERIIEKYSVTQLEKFSAIADPLLLIIGLSIWFLRVRTMITIPVNTEPEKKSPIPEETPPEYQYNPAAEFANPTPEEIKKWMQS